METMLSALHNAEELKIKELAVSAIGAIGQFLEDATRRMCGSFSFFRYLQGGK